MYIFYWAIVRWRRDRSSIVAAAVLYGYPALFGAFMLATVFVGRLNNLVWGSGAHSASNTARETQWAELLQIQKEQLKLLASLIETKTLSP